MRADQLLVERGLAASRSQAVRLIAGGLRWRDAVAGGAWHAVGKNGDLVPDSAELELADAAEARYVSRGGLKLEGALAVCGIEVHDKLCLDVGQSTGGFTDCLLQQGARHVVGVDVGHGQLHPRVAGDPRVTAIEKYNARTLNAIDLIAACAHRTGDTAEFDAKFPLITGDLSFISLTLVLPALVPLLAAPAAGDGPARRGGDLLMLVKPQFELQPGQVGKGGIVRDPALHAAVEARLRAACEGLGLTVERWFDSPIAGGDGNREFFIHARHPTQPTSQGVGRAPSAEL